MQNLVVPDVFHGKKFICLAITEAFAGSDVNGLQTYAYKDGSEWVINGTKKCVIAVHFFLGDLLTTFRWITNGMFADWFTTGCRTEVGMFFLTVYGFWSAEAG